MNGALLIPPQEWDRLAEDPDQLAEFHSFLAGGPSLDEVAWWLELNGIGYLIEARAA